MCGVDEEGHVELRGCICGCCETSRGIKFVNAFISGLVFGGGFWIMMGGTVLAFNDGTPLPFQQFLPLISSVVGFLMTALVDGELFDPRNEGIWSNPSSPSIGMGIVVAGLLFCCVGLSTSIVVLVTAYEECLPFVNGTIAKAAQCDDFQPKSDLPGVLNVVANSLLFIAAWYYRMSHWPGGKYSKRRRSNVAVIIVRVIFISSFHFYCLLLNHSFQTSPNSITNCFKLILSLLQLYNYIAPASLFDF